MKIGRRVIGYIICIALGAVLLGLGIGEIVDEFWSGMGSGLLFVGAIRLVQLYRYSKNETYREKVQTEAGDERNRFIRGKAWAWAGYLFILIISVLSIVLRVVGQNMLSLAASYTVCLMLLLYWGAYLIIRKKY